LAQHREPIQSTFHVHWPVFFAQLAPWVIMAGLFALAARSILLRGRGWEVPVWLLLTFFIPVIFPILAMIHFRNSKFSQSASTRSADAGFSR
jgi:hypothetical protein